MAARKGAVKRGPRLIRKDAPVRVIATALTGDWYWEQDAELRFTRVEIQPGAHLDPHYARHVIGRRRWETGLQTEGGWDAHRAVLQRREPFRDLIAWRDFEDGGRRYISSSGEPLYDAKGAFRGYRGIARDVTEQKRGERLLRLEHQITRLFAEADDPSGALKSALRAICESENWQLGRYLRLDARRGVLRFGEAWGTDDPDIAAYIEESRTMEYASGVGLVGKVWQDGRPLWVPDITDDARVARAGLARRTGMRGALVVPVAADGRTAGVFIFHSHLIRQPDERLLQAVFVIGGQVAQLLARAEAESALRASEARFRSLTELSSDWYWEQDAHFRFTVLSGRGASANARGGDPDVYLGRARWDIPDLAPLEGGWAAHRALLERHEPFRDVILRRRMDDGVFRYMSISGEPMFDEAGRFSGYRGSARDITRQMRDEQLLRLEHQVIHRFTGGGSIGDSLRAAIRAICEMEGWDSGRYLGVDESRGVLRASDSWCVPDKQVARYIEESRSAEYAPGIGLVGHVWKTQEPLWLVDTTDDPRVARPELSRETGLRGCAIAPVHAEGRLVGVLILESRQPRARDERLLRALRAIGGQIGLLVSRARAEESLRESEARFRALTQMSSDYFWESDAQHRVSEMAYGPNYAGKLGKRSILGMAPWDLPSTMPDEAGWARVRATMDAHMPVRDFEFGRPLPDGSARYFSVSGDPYFSPEGRFLGYRGVGRDITDAVLARERIASLAYSDPLTGLANRTSLTPTLEQAVERTRRRGSRLAGVFVDLDGFKQINDRFGHDAGDRLLVEMARRLRSHLRAGDPVARLGGDEFFVVLEDIQHTVPVDSVARKLLAGILEPFAVAPGQEATISASIGISIFPDDAGDAATLVKHADMAMYAAKQAGKNAYRFFTSGPAANDPKTGSTEQKA